MDVALTPVTNIGKNPNICNHKVLQGGQINRVIAEGTRQFRVLGRGHSNRHELDIFYLRAAWIRHHLMTSQFMDSKGSYIRNANENTAQVKTKTKTLKFLIAMCRENYVKWTFMFLLFGISYGHCQNLCS